jgi:hypothetical protein
MQKSQHSDMPRSGTLGYGHLDNDQVLLTLSTEDEKEEESSEEEDEDKRRLNDELLGKVVSVASTAESTGWYPALVSFIAKLVSCISCREWIF